VARVAEHLLLTGCLLMAAAVACLGMGAVELALPEEAAPLRPGPPGLQRLPADQPGLQQFVAACAAADSAAIPRLQELAASADPAVAGNAVRALGRLQALDVAAVAGALRDARPRVRHEAIAALGQSGNAAAAPLLLPLLASGDGQARLLAISALAQLGATDALRRLVEDPATDPATRAFARAASRPLRVPRLLATTAGLGPR